MNRLCSWYTVVTLLLSCLKPSAMAVYISFSHAGSAKKRASGLGQLASMFLPLRDSK